MNFEIGHNGFTKVHVTVKKYRTAHRPSVYLTQGQNNIQNEKTDIGLCLTEIECNDD